MRDYRKITAYKMADDLVIETYRLTRGFPKEELYGLTSQVRRSAMSVPTNIAEGASRQHKRDYLNFLFVARGSLAETAYLLYLAARLGYIDSNEYERIDALQQEVAKTLFGLIGAVEREVRPFSRSVGLVGSMVYGLWSLVHARISG